MSDQPKLPTPREACEHVLAKLQQLRAEMDSFDELRSELIYSSGPSRMERCAQRELEHKLLGGAIITLQIAMPPDSKEAAARIAELETALTEAREFAELWRDRAMTHLNYDTHLDAPWENSEE